VTYFFSLAAARKKEQPQRGGGGKEKETVAKEKDGDVQKNARFFSRARTGDKAPVSRGERKQKTEATGSEGEKPRRFKERDQFPEKTAANKRRVSWRRGMGGGKAGKDLNGGQIRSGSSYQGKF